MTLYYYFLELSRVFLKKVLKKTTFCCIFSLRGEKMFTENLKNLRKQNGYTQKDMAKMLIMSQQGYAKYETGVSSPNPETLSKIAKILNCTVEYLTDEQKDLKDDNIFPISKRKFPLLGEIACGEPIFTNEDRESYVMSGTEINADFCLKAKGDSMIGARILDGDIVFIKKSPIVNNGEIAAVIIGDEATLKRFYYYPEKGKLILQAENPKYEPLVYIGEELNEIRILGKAVAFQSDII